jgi:alpha-L-glutamate ligase-like protein
LRRYWRLRELGILGMNQRNTQCILDLNPRSKYPLVDSKRKMRDLCAAIGVPTPAIYDIVPTHSGLRRLSSILEKHADFVMKPNRGAGGRGIMVIVGREANQFVRHNGERVDYNDVRQHVSSIISGLYSLGGNPDEALIQQRVLLHPAFERISYQGVGDVRVIVYRNVPAMAMLRLPTKLSGGRANLHQGGIGAGVDVVTGITCHAVMRNRVERIHPDTNESVVGFQVPCWPQILDMACKAARAVGMGYVGVDIVLDRDQGPMLLEANARPGLAIQIANGMGLLHRLAEIDRQLELQSPRQEVRHGA